MSIDVIFCFFSCRKSSTLVNSIFETLYPAKSARFLQLDITIAFNREMALSIGWISGSIIPPLMHNSGIKPSMFHMTSSVVYSSVIKVNSFWISNSNIKIKIVYLSVVHHIFIGFIFCGKSSTMLDCIVIRLLPWESLSVKAWLVKLKDKWFYCMNCEPCLGASCASRFKPPAICWIEYIVSAFSLV